MAGHEANQGGTLSEQLEAYQRDVDTRADAYPVGESGVAERKNVGLIGKAAASRLGYEVLLRDPSDGATSQVLMFPGEGAAPEVQPPTTPQ